jgi:phospholipase/carboxylesterase
MSGYLNLEIIAELPKNDFSKLKIFASHGTVDQVIPDWARRTQQLWRKLGINTTYKEYPVGHG